MQKRHAENASWTILVLVLVLSLGLWACSDDDEESHDDDHHHGDSWDGVCTEAHDGFEKCENNRIHWCHVVAGMDPHFHEGLNCQALGLTCVEDAHEHDGHAHQQAFCVDESMTCRQGEFRCEDNIAYNCLDGVTAVSPCGTRECHEEAGQAVCEGHDDHDHDHGDHDHGDHDHGDHDHDDHDHDDHDHDDHDHDDHDDHDHA